MKFNKNKGITLIALVVTIIVLLILAGVTISLALNNNGILGRSKNAAKAYSDAEQLERNELDNISGDIDNYIKESKNTLVKMFKSGAIKVGDYIEYKPNERKTFTTKASGETEEEKRFQNGAEDQTFSVEENKNSEGDLIKWRVLGLVNSQGELDNENGNSLAIIAWDCPEKLKLNGAESYEYGIDIINKISELYKNDDLAIGARSIKMEDIIKTMGLEEKEKTIEGQTIQAYCYNKDGEDVVVFYKMTGSFEYKDYTDENGREHKHYSPASYLKGKTAKQNGEESIETEMTFGNIDDEIAGKRIGNTTVDELLLSMRQVSQGVSACWLGSRGEYYYPGDSGMSEAVMFGLGYAGVLENHRYACNLIFGGWMIFYSDGPATGVIELGVRPVIILKPDLTMEEINA